VWDANYGGVQFPRRETVVLRISAPRRSLYWRASTLDLFARDRWLETLYAVRFGPAVGDLPVDPLAPPRIGTPVRQDVVVEALDDPRLVAASVPLRLEAPTLPQVLVSSGNVLSAPLGVPGGTRYTVWSSAPRPSPSALVRSRPRYPDDLRRYLDLGRTRMPPFGEEGRASVVSTILADEARYPDLVPYTPVWREARRLAGAARSPYLATLALERWLRTSGGYTYDERPPAPPAGVPALADFTVGAKRGYCQHYAGSMALMLRMLGVPARVAVGFTSGRFADGVWTVTDWNAHAWVEAWFDGYGWLPFDPTPGRGRFSSAYSFGSDSADAVRALGTGRLLDFSPQPSGPSTQPEQPTGPQPESGSRRPLWPLLIPALAALALALVPGLKRRTRRTRLGAADPRERAAGIRLELAGRLGDHGIATASTASFGEIAHEAERQLGVSTRALVGHVLTARYAPPALARPAADAATHELDDVESAIRERVGTFQAWRAALRPRLRR
jgi:transglutaminase-like putative cysteine protease